MDRRAQVLSRRRGLRLAAVGHGEDPRDPQRGHSREVRRERELTVQEYIEYINFGVGTKPAVFSDDREHRYFLRRPTNVMGGKGICMFVGGNPSKADEEQNDMTVTKGTKWAGMWGFEWFWILNVHAVVGTDPEIVSNHSDPIGEFNYLWLRRCLELADRTIVAYGELGKTTGQDKKLDLLLTKLNTPNVYCFGLTQKGYPLHPSRIAYSTPLIEWRGLLGSGS